MLFLQPSLEKNRSGKTQDKGKFLFDIERQVSYYVARCQRKNWDIFCFAILAACDKVWVTDRYYLPLSGSQFAKKFVKSFSQGIKNFHSTNQPIREAPSPKTNQSKYYQSLCPPCLWMWTGMAEMNNQNMIILINVCKIHVCLILTIFL